MSLYKVLTFPDPFLKTVASPVIEFDQNLRSQVEIMIETMYENAGIGLAATQVGLNKRLFVMDVFYSKEIPESERDPQVIINPVISEGSDEQVMEEGCLSVPDFRAEVKRFSKLKLQYKDLDGKDRQMEGEGLLAICIQHELDHLDGKLFIDYLPSLQRAMIKKKLKKQYA